MNIIILMHVILAYSRLLFLGDSNSTYTLQIIVTAILIVSELIFNVVVIIAFAQSGTLTQIRAWQVLQFT